MAVRGTVFEFNWEGVKMGRLAIAWLLALATPVAPPDRPGLRRFQFTQTEMAVPIRIVFYAPDAQTANGAAQAAYARIHELNGILSDYDPKSELRRLSSASSGGNAIHASDDLWRVLGPALTLSERSDGAFDVTVGPVVRLWRRARRREHLPSPDRLGEARKLVGYKKVKLDAKHQTVELLKPNMRLDLGGIAKGYAVDEALKVLEKREISRVLIDAGGDIRLGDPPPGKPGWVIGIARLEPDAPPSQYLSLARTAVATSGDAWQYVEIDGRRYSHIVDPRTGLGLTDHGSVTVIAPDCITADSLASAVSVLGPEKGLKLIEATPQAATFIVRAPDGKLETHESARWKDLPVACPKKNSCHR